MTYAFLIALLAGVAGVAAFAVMWKTAQLACRVTMGERDKLKAEVAVLETALKLEQASKVDDTARLEKVIATLKAEITILENDLNACNVPDAVRARLRGLLDPVL